MSPDGQHLGYREESDSGDQIYLMNTRVKVETKDEISRIKALQKEIQQLKKLLLKKDLDAMVLDAYLEVAAEDLGYKSVSELKKS